MEYPESKLIPLCHPLVEDVTRETDDYFLRHWPFPDDKSRTKFVNAGFSRVTCLYFPKARNDRIIFACRLLTVLFLIDDLLEDMSFEDGAAYNEKLMPLCRGDVLPDRAVSVEYITYDLWQNMRACDNVLAHELLEPVFIFMGAQTDKIRNTPMGLGEYLEYREGDVGKALLGALMRFCMGLHLTLEEKLIAQPVDKNCSKHLSIINDIWSFEKEVLAAKNAHKEGGTLCNGVSILAGETTLSTGAAKRVLYHLCREWESRHEQLVHDVLVERESSGLRGYLQGLEYQMSGNEAWSKTTLRYLTHAD